MSLLVIIVQCLSGFVEHDSMGFVDRKQARALAQCQVIYIDGTFKTAPKPYKQIVTMNGLYKGQVIPLVFALSAGKEVGHYRQILQAILHMLILWSN